MPRQPKRRFKSLRGQKISKEVKKDRHMLFANMKYLRNDGVANKDGQRVGLASRQTRQSSEVQGRLKMKATHQGPNNVESLQSTSMHNHPISRSLGTTQAHMQRDHSLMNDINGNENVVDHLEVMKIKEFAPLDKSSECSRQPQFKAMEGLAHKENNINGVTKNKACPLRVKEGSTSLQAMEGLIKKIEGIDGSSKLNVMSPMPKERQSSYQEKGTNNVIDEGTQWQDGRTSKAMTSKQKYIDIDEDECGDGNNKNTNEVEVVDGGDNNPTCVEDNNHLVVQVENLTCGVMKEQREMKQDIEPDDTDQNQVVQDDNDGHIRYGFSTKMNNEATNDRGAQCLIGVDGKIGDGKSKVRKESMQEKTNVALGGGDGSEEVVRLNVGLKKKRIQCIMTDDDEEIETDDDDSEEVVRLNFGPKKKRSRYLLTSYDEEVEADDVDRDNVGIEGNERAESKAKVLMPMDRVAKVPMPFVSKQVEQQCYCFSKPIDEPIWRGTFKIDGKEYTSLVGHLSTKSGKKVWELSTSLQTSIELMKLSGSKVMPKIWNSSKPSDDNIGLYFFPDGMRYDANLDKLIKEVMEHELVLQAVIDEVEMLIFPSCLLPERYKTFQIKHYLWALFKRRDDKFAFTAKPLDGTVWCAQEEKGEQHVSNQQDDVDDVEPSQEMILMKSSMPLESEGLVNLHLHMEKQGSDGIRIGGMDHSVNCKSQSPAESTQQASASCVPSATNIGFQLKAPDEGKQENARRHSVHAAEATAAASNSAVLIAEATALATNTANIPADHEQFNSSMEVPQGMYLFVAKKTPRVEQILKELDRELALVFARPLGAGTGPDSIATTMQLL